MDLFVILEKSAEQPFINIRRHRLLLLLHLATGRVKMNNQYLEKSILLFIIHTLFHSYLCTLWTEVGVCMFWSNKLPLSCLVLYVPITNKQQERQSTMTRFKSLRAKIILNHIRSFYYFWVLYYVTVPYDKIEQTVGRHKIVPTL